jgi:hypothetical protein
MYKVFQENKISREDLTIIVHYLVGILNKFKSKENREIDISKISNAPTGNNYKIAEDFLEEINIKSLFNNDLMLNSHIEQLYELLKARLDNELKPDNINGELLLQKLRKN